MKDADARFSVKLLYGWERRWLPVVAITQDWLKKAKRWHSCHPFNFHSEWSYLKQKLLMESFPNSLVYIHTTVGSLVKSHVKKLMVIFLTLQKLFPKGSTPALMSPIKLSLILEITVALMIYNVYLKIFINIDVWLVDHGCPVWAESCTRILVLFRGRFPVCYTERYGWAAWGSNVGVNGEWRHVKCSAGRLQMASLCARQHDGGRWECFWSLWPKNQRGYIDHFTL